MTVSNAPGRPTELTEEVQARIFISLPKVLIQRQVAFAAMVHPSTLQTWLNRGEKDQLEGVESIYAQFSCKYLSLRAAEIAWRIYELGRCPDNLRGLTWVLERCFREDFGAEAAEIKELRELFTQILPLLSKGIADDEQQQKADDQTEPQGQAAQSARRERGQAYT